MAFGGGGGISQRMHTLPQESPQQDPEMQMHTGARLGHGSGRQAEWSTAAEAGDRLVGPHVLCRIQMASDYI